MAAALSAALLVGVAGWISWTPAKRFLARRHFSRAEQLLAARDDSGALAELTSALEANPLVPHALRLRGELYLRGQKLEHAFLDLQSSTEAFPDEAEGWSDLAQVRLLASQPEEAEAAISHAIELAPDRAGLRLRRAQLRARIGRWQGALLDAKGAISPDGAAQPIVREATARLAAGGCAPPRFEPRPLDAARWPGDLGQIIRAFLDATHAGNWSAVTALVGRVQSGYPHGMMGPWLEGMASLRSGDLDHAERAFLAALAATPRAHRPISNLVALWSRKHGPAYTAERLSRLVDGDPDFAYPLPIAAAAYLEDGRPTKAEATIRRLFRTLPASPVPFREVARFFLQLDRVSDAIATAAQGLALHPGDAELLHAQALGYLKLGDREAAIGSWEAALAARPDDQVAAAQLAALLTATRKDAPSRDRALSLVRSLECDAPSDPDVLETMGTVLLDAAKDAAGAQPWLEAARDRAPESPQVRYHLALAYARTQDVASARRELQRALQGGQTFEGEPEARRLLRDLEERKQ